MDLKHLIFLVCYYLCVGTFASFGFVKEKEVGDRYYLYHGLMVFGLGLLAYLGLGTSSVARDTAIWISLFLLATLAYSLPWMRNKKISRALYFLAVLSGFGAIIMDISFNTPRVLHTPLIWNSALSALLMGFSMAAMLLGHWYLTQPKMSIDELKRVSIALIVVISVRFLVGSAVFFQDLWGLSEMEIYNHLLKGSVGTFSLMRWIWGLLAPMVLTYFIWGTVKIRSTQSATGLLYVLVLFVMTGEILSQYLAFFHGMAF